MSLHKRDEAFLKEIMDFFGVGSITKSGPETLQYAVQSTKDLAIIIKHFDEYPLITQKRGDFELFKMAFELIQSKAHLTAEGLAKVVSIKASMN
jgi:hypothetical protein